MILFIPRGWGIDFIIDIDRTLGLYVHDHEYPHWKSDPQVHFIEQSDGRYRLYHGAAEFIQSLSEIPGARISFYSGGPESRNFELLENIKLPNGKSALDISEGRVYSRRHLREDSHRKRILEVIPGVDEQNVVHIDDNLDYAAYHHKETGRPLHFLHVFDLRDDDFNPQYAQDYQAVPRKSSKLRRVLNFEREESRLLWVRGYLDEALERAKREGRPIAQILHDDQFADGKADYKIFKKQKYYHRGLKKLKEVNPKLEARKVWVYPCLRRHAETFLNDLMTPNPVLYD